LKKIGIIGCGFRAREVAQNVVKAGGGAIEVAALCDISQTSITDGLACFPNAVVCDDYHDMLAREDIDWILVGSFNAAHREHVIPALDAGKHIFCEKPLATTQEDCLAMLAASRAHAGHFVVGFVLRYSPFYIKIKELLNADAVGDIISFEFNETLHPNHGAAMHGNWRRRCAIGGSFLLEKCCHDMDLMLWLTDTRPSRIASFGGLNFFKAANAHVMDRYEPNGRGIPFYGLGRQTGWAVGKEDNISPFNDDKDVIDNQVAILEMENGIRATFHLCTHAPIQERRFYICGTKGAIRGDVLTGEIEYRPVGWKPETENFKPIEGGGHGNADGCMAEDLADCILNDTPMPTTLLDGVRSAFTCFGIDQAMDTGTIVDMSAYWATIR